MALKTDREKIAHILRRFGLGSSEAELDFYSKLGYDRAVDTLLDDASPDPGANLSIDDWLTDKDGSNPGMVCNWWILRMLATQKPLIEKMTLFWHNHFATNGQGIIYSKLAYNQNEVLRRNALGNFRTMLHDVSIDPAMIFWLNSNLNVKGRPNENFAREVMELFTLGIGHYTEHDVQEGARAFTGWTVREIERDKNGLRQFEFVFNTQHHDSGVKTFRGQTANFAGEDILNALCDDRRTSEYITWKMWDWFVYRNPEPAVVTRVARAFYDSGLEIKALIRAILKSPECFSAKAEREVVKSPIDVCITTARQLGIGSMIDISAKGDRKANLAVANTIRYGLREMGMMPLFPPDVHGWDYGESWITTATMVERIKWPSRLLGVQRGRMPFKYPVTELFGGEMEPGPIVDRLVALLDAPLTRASRDRVVAEADKLLDVQVDDENALNTCSQLVALIIAAPEFQFA